MQNKTFRLFISSTFSDFNQERRLLQMYVFPEIKKYCRELEKGYIFQPIDLRWGVSNEAQLDQKALELCIEEVQSSKSQPHPNFLIMAGNRYGWVPLPYAIEQTEFEAIRENVEDTTLLDTWYKLDNNQLPASYIIQKRSGEYEGYDVWVKVENSLRKILQEAVEKTPLSNVQKEKYFTSATEAEVVEGIFGYKTITSFQEALAHKDPDYPLLDSEHLYGYIRDVKSVEDENFYGMFIDEDVKQTNQFKDELIGAIKKENILVVEANLTNLSKDKKNGSLNYSFEAIENEEDSQFVTTMIKFIKQSIDSYEVEEAFTPQELEAYEQERFKEDKLKLFIGREEPLKSVQAYIESDNDQPLVIYGPSGMGKSALMAKAIDETKKEKVYRFVGSTATLSSSEQLVISILKALGIEEHIRQIQDETGQAKREPIEEFYLRVHEHLKSISDEKVIFIDAVDQLSNEDEFIWLPSKLPSKLKIIISALEDDTYSEDTKYFTVLKGKTSNLYKLEKFEESETLIKSILKQYDRTITDTQLTYLQNIYKDVNTPLYLTIAAQEMRHWSSVDKIIDVDPHGKKLASTQKSIIAEYIENLTDLYHHDEELVKRVLSYLYLTEGLSEAELLELLSTDEAFVGKVAPETYHYNITTKDNITKELPSVIWARLHTQLKAFIKYEEKNGQETMSFFHREFNDSISHQEDIQARHEELIELVYKLMEKYQDESFESNRWGKLYIVLVKDYHIKYEFDYLLDEDSNLYIYTTFVTRLSDAWIDRILFVVNNQGRELAMANYGKDACTYLKFSYFMFKNTNLIDEEHPSNLLPYYIDTLTNLSIIYSKINQYQLSINLTKEMIAMIEMTEKFNIYEEFIESYIGGLNNLSVFIKEQHSFSNRYEKTPDEAIEYEMKALNKISELYEKDDRWAYSYVITLINVSISLSDRENVKQAIKYSLEALETTRKYYDEDEDKWSNNLIRVLINLGLFYKDDDLNEAIKYAKEAKEISFSLKEKFGDKYVKLYFDSIINFAGILQTKDIQESILRQHEAEELIRDYYNNEKNVWIYDYIKILNNLAHSYKIINEYQDAEKYNLLIIEICESNSLIHLDMYRIAKKELLLLDAYSSLNVDKKIVGVNCQISDIDADILLKNVITIFNENFSEIELSDYIAVEELISKDAAKKTVLINWLIDCSNLAQVYYKHKNFGAAQEFSDIFIECCGTVLSDDNIKRIESVIISLYNTVSSSRRTNFIMIKGYNDKQESEDTMTLQNNDDSSPGLNLIEQLSQLIEEAFIKKYTEPFTTLLYIAKGLSIQYNESKEIGINEFYNALHSVELSQDAESIFRQIFGNAMNHLNDDNDGYNLIELAKKYPKIQYDDNMKNLVKQLKEIFEDDLILNVREASMSEVEINEDEIPF